MSSRLLQSIVLYPALIASAVALIGCRSSSWSGSTGSPSVTNADFDCAPDKVDNREVTQLQYETAAHDSADSASSEPASFIDAVRDQKPDQQFFPQTQSEKPRRGDEGEGADGVARVTGRVQRAVENRAAPTGFPSPGRIVDDRVSPVSFSAAEPRLDVAEDGAPINDPAVSWVTGTDPQRYRDEYLFDGGDRGFPLHYEGSLRMGMETEDTVAEYQDHKGQKHQKATNQVAIYAPRFGAVRTVSSPSGDTAVAKLAGIQMRKRDSGVKNRIGPDDYTTRERLKGIGTRSRASGLETREWERGVFNTARLESHTKLINLFEEFTYFLRGEIHVAEEVRLAGGIEAARQWTQKDGLKMVATTDSLQQVEATSRAAGMVGLEDEAPGVGDLRIVKIADRNTAKPGDLITFIIRYDNLGDGTLHDVRIVDNLSPRLEFIEESASSDLPGAVNMENNEEGSLVLTFALDNPLPGRKITEAAKNRAKKIATGGVITFQCRVR